ncbi:hypothetical protein DB346_07340 [Verrucomicrobia bacterium LW23]|nr:hypothetical protein DB346_07340 [Verrucomicrobia bacterium LW23]
MESGEGVRPGRYSAFSGKTALPPAGATGWGEIGAPPAAVPAAKPAEYDPPGRNGCCWPACCGAGDAVPPATAAPPAGPIPAIMLRGMLTSRISGFLSDLSAPPLLPDWAGPLAGVLGENGEGAAILPEAAGGAEAFVGEGVEPDAEAWAPPPSGLLPPADGPARNAGAAAMPDAGRAPATGPTGLPCAEGVAPEGDVEVAGGGVALVDADAPGFAAPTPG